MAHDGEDTVRAAKECRPDAVLDLGMPKMNGDNACRAMRAQSSDAMKMIAVTGRGQEATGYKARLPDSTLIS